MRPPNTPSIALATSLTPTPSSSPGLATSGRVATARFEMLHLTEESYKLAAPLASPAVREFLVPTQVSLQQSFRAFGVMVQQ